MTVFAFVLACVLIICAVCSCDGSFPTHERFWQQLQRPSVQMVSAKEFEIALQSDTSNAYFDNMGPSDLIARLASSRQQYRSRYVHSFTPVHPYLRSKLSKLAALADTLTKGHENAAIAALPSIPWKIALVDSVEGGMPHTHADIICLPSGMEWLTPRDALRTLIHEKIHVLQRVRPDLTSSFISEHGYYRVCQRAELDWGVLRRARSNPDLDQNIYGKNGRVSIFQLSKQPVSLTDGTTVTLVDDHTETRHERYEHPFEMMAHTLSELLVPY